jgi:hypothetical protein
MGGGFESWIFHDDCLARVRRGDNRDDAIWRKSGRWPVTHGGFRHVWTFRVRALVKGYLLPTDSDTERGAIGHLRRKGKRRQPPADRRGTSARGTQTVDLRANRRQKIYRRLGNLWQKANRKPLEGQASKLLLELIGGGSCGLSPWASGWPCLRLSSPFSQCLSGTPCSAAYSESVRTSAASGTAGATNALSRGKLSRPI